MSYVSMIVHDVICCMKKLEKMPLNRPSMANGPDTKYGEQKQDKDSDKFDMK